MSADWCSNSCIILFAKTNLHTVILIAYGPPSLGCPKVIIWIQNLPDSLKNITSSHGIVKTFIKFP